MNNEEKKVEGDLATNIENLANANDPNTASPNKQVDFITRRPPLKDWSKKTIDRCIIIYNIDYTITEDQLMEHFKKVNGFEKMYLLKDPHHTEFANRGIAYVIYSQSRDADFATKKLNHTLIGNRRIRIERSIEQEPKPKLKQSKKDWEDPLFPERPLLDPEALPIYEVPYYSHLKSSKPSEHSRRSHRSSHLIDFEEGLHHHSYRHRHSSSHATAQIDLPGYEFIDHRSASLNHRAPIQMVSSAPLFHDYRPISPPVSQLYMDKPKAAPKMKVDNEVEDKINELSILFELYRDALLNQNINDMKVKKKDK